MSNFQFFRGGGGTSLTTHKFVYKGLSVNVNHIYGVVLQGITRVWRDGLVVGVGHMHGRVRVVVQVAGAPHYHISATLGEKGTLSVQLLASGGSDKSH